MKKLLCILILFCCAGAVFAGDTYYVNVKSAKVRSCPKTSCSVLVKLDKGTAIDALEEVKGDPVSKSTVWYRIDVDGKEGYIHRSLVSAVAPKVSNATAVPSRSTGKVPKNCTEAKAMGLTAEQAAQYPGLDRDHDGVACYGD